MSARRAMRNRRIVRDLVSVSVLLTTVALAADMPIGPPNQTAELDMLLMPSDVAIGIDGRTYVVDSGNHQVAVFAKMDEVFCNADASFLLVLKSGYLSV